MQIATLCTPFPRERDDRLPAPTFTIFFSNDKKAEYFKNINPVLQREILKSEIKFYQWRPLRPYIRDRQKSNLIKTIWRKWIWLVTVAIDVSRCATCQWFLELRNTRVPKYSSTGKMEYRQNALYMNKAIIAFIVYIVQWHACVLSIMNSKCKLND